MRVFSSISGVIGVAILIAGNGVSFAAPQFPPEEATRFAEAAAAGHPDVASARAEAEGQHALARHHRGLEAPEIAVDFYQAPVSSFPNPTRDQRELDYSVSQQLPFPGKLGGMAEPEHRRGEAAEMRADAVALDVRRDALTAYADLYAAEWGLRLARGNRADVEALLGETRRGYASGGGASTAVLRLEAELARLDMAIAEREGARGAAAANLAALRGDSGRGADLRLDSLTLPDIAVPVATGAADLKTGSRPELDAARLEAEAARAEAVAARREYYPDFTLRGTYKEMRGMPDDWSLMVGMTVPFAPWARRGAEEGTRRARAMAVRADRDLEAARRRATGEAEGAASEYAAATRRAIVARDRLVPTANALLAATRREYGTGSVPFSEVVDALREVRMAREEYHQAAAAALKAWAALQRAGGAPVRAAVEETKS